MAKWLQWTNGNKCHSKLYQQMTANGKYQANGKQMAITSANDKWVPNIKQMANKWQLKVQEMAVYCNYRWMPW